MSNSIFQMGVIIYGAFPAMICVLQLIHGFMEKVIKLGLF